MGIVNYINHRGFLFPVVIMVITISAFIKDVPRSYVTLHSSKTRIMLICKRETCFSDAAPILMGWAIFDVIWVFQALQKLLGLFLT